MVHGAVPAALATLGLVSMFRNPLIYFGRRALGLPVRLPEELQGHDGLAGKEGEMTLSLILGFCWMIAANVVALFPSRRNHWPAAYVLIALGVPLLGYVTLQNGPWVGLLMLAGARVDSCAGRCGIFGRWLRRRVADTPVAHGEEGHG